MAKLIIGFLFKLAPFLIIFYATLFQPADLDMGWHLKYGEYFFTHHSILRDNNFSTMMPDYKWVNSSWGTDLITYSIYNLFGFLGISVLGALIATLTFFVFSKAARLTTWDQVFLFPVLLYLELPLIDVAFRGQLLSMLFIGIVFLLTQLYEVHKDRKILLTIPLFMVWVNLHGEFLLGLAFLAAWISLYAIKLKFLDYQKLTRIISEHKLLLASFFGSILASLANPFGIGPYLEAIHHFGNPLQKYISEWLPFVDYSNLWWNHMIMVVLVTICLIGLMLNQQLRPKATVATLIIIFLSLSFWMRRYAWPTYFLTLIIIQPLVASLMPKGQKAYYISLSIFLALFLGTVIWWKGPINKITNYNWNSYYQNIGFSAPATEVFAKIAPGHNYLTAYDWGGTIIWNYPQIKPSIDGRMHLWKDDNGYSAFSQYYSYEQNLKDVDDSPYNLILMSTQKTGYKHLQDLAASGKWTALYQDMWGGVFMRNQTAKNSIRIVE